MEIRLRIADERLLLDRGLRALVDAEHDIEIHDIELVEGPPTPTGEIPLLPVVPARLSSLTRRELEVLRLVARGLSNREIADELVLSEATVKSHVCRIRGKLRLRDRVQMVVLAYESGFVTRRS